ncbi:MAG: histidinol-phosphatase [Cyclobacteriaceae bacterium]|nr:histidinol-phosphatase [Cyclobacteriaceae bacterium]
MWANYHTHSNYCDGKSTFEQHLDKAKQLDVKALGFSSHAPVPFDCLWCMKANRLDDYLASIQNLKSHNQSIEIYSGLEVDFIPQVIGPRQFSNRLDYTIGSVHFVDRYENGKHWEIDGLHSFFLDGLEKIFKNDYQRAFTRYFELTREMIQQDCPTVIGHLDKMKIQNPENKFFAETESWYQEQVKDTISAIAKTNAIVEVNTRGIYQKKTDTTYPSPWILELLLTANIPITISSDAHHADDLVNQFESTAQLLSEIGFKKIHILYHDEWKPFNFNKKGIEF